YITLWSNEPELRQTGRSCSEGAVFDEVMEILGGVEGARAVVSLGREQRDYVRGTAMPWWVLADPSERDRLAEEAEALKREDRRLSAAGSDLEQLSERVGLVRDALEGESTEADDSTDVRVVSPLRPEIELSLASAIERTRSLRESKELCSRLE